MKKMSSGKWVEVTRRLIMVAVVCWGVTGLLSACSDNDSITPRPEQQMQTTRDDKGVWFITGPDDASYYQVMDAMGYAVATDRFLWSRDGVGGRSTKKPHNQGGSKDEKDEQGKVDGSNPAFDHGGTGLLGCNGVTQRVLR